MIPVIFSYLLKLSISLAVVFLFYRLVLQKLTFYGCNRWYLLSFTALSFFIPLIDVAPLVEPKQAVPVAYFVPQVAEITSINFIRPEIRAPGYNLWPWFLGVLVTGSCLLLTRSLIQYFSFLKIRRQAQLISDKPIKIYQVEADIIPFSFGRSIFLNRMLHQEQDLQEIIRHELVHVQQGHTLDIIWMEFVCILNWYNPFAWLLRHHLRQNLEFIADNQVLQTGIDKKYYQYLLLQVKGVPAFGLVQQFNFSPLKKRIIMMNKLPSTRPHLTKFLLLLPLMAVLLLAFRGKDQNAGLDGNLLKENYLEIINQVDNSPQNEPKALMGWQIEDNNKKLLIFHDGSQELCDLNTKAGKERFKEAQQFVGDAYRPEDPKRKWPAEFKTFLERNPQVAQIKWRYDREQLRSKDFPYFADRLYLTLKSGTEEVYPIESKADLTKVESKFGKLPMLPPPIPLIN